MSSSTRGAVSAATPETRRLGLLALCALALLMAAFAFPGTLGAPEDPSAGPGDNGTGMGTATQTPSDGERTEPTDAPGGGPSGNGTGVTVQNGTTGNGTVEFSLRPGQDGEGAGNGSGVRLVLTGGNGTADGELVVEDGEAVRIPECVAVIGDDPTPGADVPVYVFRDGRAAEGVAVRFNGEGIGRTSAGGRVVGRVPYTRELSVSVSMPGVETCTIGALSAVSDPDTSESVAPAAELARCPMSAPIATVGSDTLPETPGDSLQGSPRGLQDAGKAGAPAGSIDAQETPTGNVSVDGVARVRVEGEAYPTETVRLVATVDGVPMRNAAVSVDGSRVGETDANGAYDLTVPADRRADMRVTVERGDFAATTVVDVPTLQVDLERDSLLVLPGDSVDAVVTADDQPVAGTTVAVGDDRIGTTDDAGRTELSAPTDPTATVRTNYRGLTASAAFWPLYVPLALTSLLLVGTVAGATWRYGRRRGLHATGAVAALVIAYAAYRLDGRRGLLVAVTVMAVLGGAWWTSNRRQRVAREASEAREGLAAFVEWLATLAVRAVHAIEVALAWLAGVAARLHAWLATTPRSFRGIVRAVLAWLVETIRAAPRAILGATIRLARLPFAILSWLRNRDGRASGPEPGTRSERGRHRSVIQGGNEDEGSEAISLREAWRRFARRVVRRDWRRRTPGEVARTAIEQGLPRESVLVLTNVFRDVEYGHQRPSAERIERAREAFRQIDAEQRGDGEAGD